MLKTLLATALVAPLVLLAAGIEPPPVVQDVLGRPAAPEAMSLALGAVAGLIAAAWARGWVGRLTTLVHEFGHSLMAMALGLRVHWVVLNRDGGGLTAHAARGPIRSTMVSLAGYLAPVTVAGSLLLATAHGLIREWLVYMALALALGTVFQIRSAAGWLVGVLSVAGLVGAAYAVDREPLSALGFGLGLALGVGGLRSASHHVLMARSGATCDATDVARIWPVPGTLVASTQVMVCVAALGFAAWRSVQLVLV